MCMVHYVSKSQHKTMNMYTVMRMARVSAPRHETHP